MSAEHLRPGAGVSDPWLTIREAVRLEEFRRARLNARLMYSAIARGELRAARLGIGRRKLVLRASWVRAWLEAAAPQETSR